MQPQRSEQPVLITRKTARSVDPTAAFRDAAKLPGQSSLRLEWRLFQSTRSPQNLTFPEFFSLGLYRPELSRPEIAAFVGRISNARFTDLLNGPDSDNEAEALNDKLESARRLASAGIPIAGVRAVFPGNLALGKAEVLASAAEIAAYLVRPESSPCLGKPIY